MGEDNVALNEPMSEHTSFRIGGPADLFVTPDDIDELRDVIAACKAAGVPHFVLGCGSDLLGGCSAPLSLLCKGMSASLSMFSILV